MCICYVTLTTQVTGSADFTLNTYDLFTGKVLRKFTSHEAAINSVDYKVGG